MQQSNKFMDRAPLEDSSREAVMHGLLRIQPFSDDVNSDAPMPLRSDLLPPDQADADL
jgi:hypothetical protein